jgi:hypothetical protein
MGQFYEVGIPCCQAALLVPLRCFHTHAQRASEHTLWWPLLIAGGSPLARTDHPGFEVSAKPGLAHIPSWSSVDRCRGRQHPDETWEQWRREAEQLARNPGDL